MAEHFDCVMTPCPSVADCTDTPHQVVFAIDRNQFVDPVDRRDPPRRKVSMVQTDTTRFNAEPFILGNLRGFSAASGRIMFVVQPDGSAMYRNTDNGRKRIGQCRITGAD